MNWPVLKRYSHERLRRIALPLGGIGTGTISLGGRGDLRDWEIMNRPAKGFTPSCPSAGTFRCGPFFALFAQSAGGRKITRALEGPLDTECYEGQSGARALNHGLPRFKSCSFEAAYPLGQVHLADPAVPLRVTMQAFNPLVPADIEASSLPFIMLRYLLHNPTRINVTASVCGSIPNFIGQDGSPAAPGACRNISTWRNDRNVRGIFMESGGVNRNAEQWGTIAFATTETGGLTHRLAWKPHHWGSALLDFWDDFSSDGCLEPRPFDPKEHSPMASLAVKTTVKPMSTVAITFMIAWHFPNRYTWTPRRKIKSGDKRPLSLADRIGNHYTTVFKDAWDTVRRIAPRLPALETETVSFVSAFCRQDIPASVKEAALFNLTALRSQTSFRTPDGRFYGYEGCGDHAGCCLGSATHVWNYDQSTPFLFGKLAQTMREVEFAHATGQNGLMAFRVHLPLGRAMNFGKAAADGQLGCILKLYREWQLSGDDQMLRRLWPHAKRALEFCWIKGGWDANRDGVMEGCQHNTMDVEYFGPNPQMQGWYLGALRAAEIMADYAGDAAFSGECRHLFLKGSAWMDKHLFNGEYYEHLIQPPGHEKDVAECLRLGGGAKDITKPDFQLGAGCLVDQLVGQMLAHVCGLGYLHNPAHIRRTLRSIMKFNYRKNLSAHFNCLRSYALGNEAALLMAGYPKQRTDNPFPYFTEVMTGFEYTAAIGMLYEGLRAKGLLCIANIRNRYDGCKRSPFNEAECGHHYARAMVAWAAIPALTGFQYSAVNQIVSFAAETGECFWSTGYAWGTCRRKIGKASARVTLRVMGGTLSVKTIRLAGFGQRIMPRTWIASRGIAWTGNIQPNAA